ncbi:hypothetical protein EGW08_001224, partial [Elysia chlorotica]
NVTFDINTYKCSDKGLILPAINEYTWNEGVRAFLYMVGMLWCFLGIAIVSDTFMCGIEHITSKTRLISVPDPETGGTKSIEVKVWNDTVANLTLLAFGTSAPEILLNVIEIVGHTFKAGELGPGTIVGSAAFNLFMITGICILSIPDGDVRKIRNLRVFAVTSCFGVLAYVWMTMVLLVITPEQVDLWEAILTLLLFPALIFAAYLADKGPCCRSNKTGSGLEIGLNLDSGDPEHPGTADIINVAREVARDQNLNEDEAARAMAAKIARERPKPSGWYRVNATRVITGGHRLVPKANHMLDDVRRNHTIFFPLSHRVETIDGTAQAVEDYKPINQLLTFREGESSKEVYIEIVDDDVWEPDEFFFVKLYRHQDGSPEADLEIGKLAINQVTIVNDDEPGKLEFSKPSYIVKESMESAQLTVNRINGADGEVKVEWKTQDMSAVSGREYKGGQGTVVFKHGETSQLLTLDIYGIVDSKLEPNFQVQLSDPTGGAQLGKIPKTIVTIINDEAITFVALGTSMPDTFASRSAAKNERWADSSIGNINGSNSVNVFLGLGLPWLLASIYWEIKGEKFAYPTGSLSMTVTLFTVFAVLCLGLLLVCRRRFDLFGKAELGGARIPKLVSAGICLALWVIYIVLSSLQAQGIIDASF